MSTAPVNPTDRNPIPFGGGGGGRGRNQRPEIHASLQKLFDRMPPQSLEAEMSLLGSMILDPRVISDVLSHVRSPEDFYKPAHGIIFQTILEISDRHHMGEADLVLLFERLRDRGISDEIGGASYLRELAESVPVATNAVYYAKTVSEKARLRRLIDAAGQMLYDAYHLGDLGADAAQQVVDHAEKAIFDIAHSSETNDPEALAILLKREMDRIDAADGTMSGLATGFYELDKLLRGLQPGEMIILAARPSMGKCLASDSEIVGADGSVSTIEELFRSRDRAIPTLGADLRFRCRTPSNFIDDGKKPVFEVRTRLGRRVRTTLTHPFLTPRGWTQLANISVGDHVAAPLRLPIFGAEPMRSSEIKLLAYLIGDGGLTQSSPRFTNSNPRVLREFTDAVEEFGGVRVRDCSSRDWEAPSVRVRADAQGVGAARADFAQRLSTSIERTAISGRSLATAVGVSPASVTHWRQGATTPDRSTFERLCQVLEVEKSQLAPLGLERAQTNTPNPLTLWLGRHGLMGRDSHAKAIPPAVFKLPEEQLALFLNRLFATDGWASVLASGQAQVGYASVNERLARQIQHLLTRFGIVSRLKHRFVKYKDSRRSAFQLDITDQRSIRTFAARIGIFGKEAALEAATTAIDARLPRSYADNLPVDFWHTIEKAKGSLSWSELSARCGGATLKPFRRSIPRPLAAKIADALASAELKDLAESDVLWDRVESIRSLGEQQVYDLTMPETHNFVADDICVHNTAFALNIAEQISMGEAAEQANPSEPLALALFSLEMSKAAVSLRLLSARAGVNGGKLRTGSLHDEEYDRLFAAYRELSRSPMYIDDSAGLTIMQLRARARRLAAKHNIKLIIVDYLQLLTAPGSGRESRQVEVSEISRGIKALSRDLNVPIICLSQLNRASEQREGNRPRMSDLRESGSIEQDADVIMLLHREDYYHRGEPSWDPMHPDFNEENRDKLDTAEVIVAKQRNGPTGIVKLKWDKEVTKFRNYDPHATPPPDFAADYNQSRRPAGGFAPGGKPSGSGGYSSVGQSGGQGGGHGGGFGGSSGTGGSSGIGYSSPSSAAEQFPGNPPKRTGFPSSRPTGPVSNFRDGGGPDKDGPTPGAPPTDTKRPEPPPFDEDDLGNIPV